MIPAMKGMPRKTKTVLATSQIEIATVTPAPCETHDERSVTKNHA
jgi:hypothetical protein